MCMTSDRGVQTHKNGSSSDWKYQTKNNHVKKVVSIGDLVELWKPWINMMDWATIDLTDDWANK